jgi:NAD(P)-dependent dehydrogenase (short-subunit alcohol dehydrogenase family)
VRLHHKVAVITGAGAGLGRAIALAFAAEGAQVIAVSLLAQELEEVRETADETGLAMETIAADVGDPAETAAVAESVLGRYGRVNVLVNNAGIIYVKPIEETTPEEWDRLINTNLRGPFLYCRAFAAAMKTQRDGVIINVSSQSGVKGFVGEAAYCPSKFGLEGLTHTLAIELDPWNIRVVTVHPGIGMRTPMSMTTYDEESRRNWRDPMEIAPGFVHLAASTDPRLTGRRFSAWQVARQGLPAGLEVPGA